MIFICQIVQPTGARSPAFPVTDFKKLIEDIRGNAVRNDEFEEIKNCGILLLLAIKDNDSFDLSTMPVYSVGRYCEAFDSGIGLPDFELIGFQQLMQDFVNQEIQS
nr:MAG: hypothetical protein [Microvirus sp.]